MMKTIFTAALVGVSLMTLAGCQYTRIDHGPPLGADFGNATAHNAAVQIIDPVPANASAGAPDYDGARTIVLIDAYKSGATEEVSAEGTD